MTEKTEAIGRYPFKSWWGRTEFFVNEKLGPTHAPRYVRYMDDWVILAKTRWALRRVVQQVNTILDCSRCGGRWGCREESTGKISAIFDARRLRIRSSLHTIART